ncbi:3-(3-hydroxy-phenyl)propionate transporter MhpT [Novosphingobium sp.]|uniref:3-(3-hydroxy-phenyl)propionate transporter MhpT n=1 Tax=Novosphingobium sp. TaxID=1874826 RepID=UPI0038BCE1F8
MPGSIARNHGALTVLICFLVAICEGVDLQAAGVAAPHIVPLFGLTPVQTGWFFSSSTLGLLIGAPLAGWLADRVGRKLMLVISIVVFSLFALSTAFAFDFDSLLVVRFATGIGLGGAAPNLVTLASENSRPDRRGLAVALMYCGMPLGGAMASLVTMIGGSDWRDVFYLGGGVPLILVPFVIIALKDSHREALAKRTEQQRVGIVRALFGDGRAASTVLLWTAFSFILLVMYLLLNWLPSLLVGRGFTRTVAAQVQIAFNLGGVLGCVVIGRLIDSSYRLIVALASFVATIAFLLALAAMPAVTAVAIVVGALVGFGILGNQAMLYAFAPQCYPASVRGTGVGAAVAAARLGSLLGPLVAGQLLGAGEDAATVLYAMLPFVGVGAIAGVMLSVRRMPEFHAHSPNLVSLSQV